ncbi:MAG: 4'-phosphopantetheinyl transferase superfamily protein [Myxococcota bacterium]
MEAQVELIELGLDREEAEVQALRTLLSEEERARADRFVFPRDQRRFTVARASLRKALAARLGTTPEALAFHYEEHGKPRLKGDALIFNLSHSGERAVIAISSGPRVGVDIEAARPEVDIHGLAEYTYSPAEFASFLSLPESLRRAGFFRCWTSKEAFVKTLGLGFSFPLRDFDVEVDPRRPAAILALRAPGLSRARYAIQAFADDPVHPIAVVVEAEELRVQRGFL